MEARRGVKPTTGEVGRGSVRAGAFRVALPRDAAPLMIPPLDGFMVGSSKGFV
jgi:hypothetical protein